MNYDENQTPANAAPPKTPAQRAMPYGIAGGAAGGTVMVYMLHSPDIVKSIFFFVVGGLIFWRITFAATHFLFRTVFK